MSYTIDTTVTTDFDTTIEHVTQALSREGFGILTEIDVQATMKAKLDEDVPPYRILGACNPPFAFQALQAEPRIGAMLPCNVIVRDTGDGTVEVSAVDPIASMQAVENPALADVAGEVRRRLETVVASLR